MGPELKLGLNSRPSHEIAERSQRSHISGIPGRFFAGSASVFLPSVFLQRRWIAGSSPAMTTEHLHTVGETAGRHRFMRSRPGGLPAKSFYGKRGTAREVAHWCWRNELYDPLSSFVPELEPRRRRGFSFGSGP